MRPSPRALAVALAALAACSDNQLPPQITPVDGLPDDLAPELLREVAALDPRLDTDGDGLMDLDELVGWTLRVDETGRPQGIITRIVTSDPDMADTDGDGVLDGVERMVGSDPRLADTDGDGLDDYQEVYRWGTSPASVDSDGDSRGKEPNPSGAPDITLFDAAELQLTADPANPSGPNAQQIAGPLATSPLLADTDGDGVWDWDENSTRTRSSTLADVPRLVIGVKPASRAGFYLNLTIYEETTRTEERGKDLAFGAGLATSIGNTTTHEISTWLSGSVALGGVLNIGISTEQVGADVGLNVEEEVGMGIKNTLTTEFRADSTVSTSFSQVLSEVSSDGQTRTQTIDGGRIKLLIDVTNISTVPCKVRNLSLQLARFDPVIAKTRPVAQLRPTTNADKDLILGANKSVTVEVEAQDVQADRMIALMKNPGLMILAPANYDVLTAGDDDYDFIEADIADRTARVTLDFGPDDVTVYDVAAHVGKDASGRATGVSLAEVLTRLGIAYDADPLDNPDFQRFQQFIFKI
ncbi:MAG: hypothetical protein JNJ59_00405, partial [Deltaproteobacteria bacterium]|nr:hypothetical protein [Deltaproteobacteria bacterium]